MSRFGDLLGGQKPAPAPTPAPAIEKERPDLGLDETKYDELVEEEVVETISYESDVSLDNMSKAELEEYGRELGIELDRRHSKKRLISEIEEALDNL